MSANKLAGKYESFIKSLSGPFLPLTGMRSEIAHEKPAKEYLPFDLKCLFQFGATHARSPQSLDKVFGSMQKRKKLETITVRPSSVFE